MSSTLELRRDAIIKRSIDARNDYIQRLWIKSGIRTKKRRHHENEDDDISLSNIYHATMFRSVLPYKNRRPSNKIAVFVFDKIV